MSAPRLAPMDKTLHEIELEAWSQRASLYDSLFAHVSTQAIDAILDGVGTLQGKRLLDVACGTGHLAGAASRRGAISEGIDFAQSMIDAARTNYPRGNYQVADATELPYEDGTFDAVTCSFGLSHMENPQAAVAEAWRVLKPGGRYAFTLWLGENEGNELMAIVKTALAINGVTDSVLPVEWTRWRIADEDACAAATQQAGFAAPVFKTLPIVCRTHSARDAADIFYKLSVRSKMIIDRQPALIRQCIYDQVVSEIEAHRVNGVISLKWPALLTIVQKPR